MKSFLLSTAILVVLSGAVSAQELSEEDVKRLVLETILENPEIIFEAAAIVRAKEEEAKQTAQKSAMADNLELMTQDANAPFIGNPDGDVTIVEFFDYNCSYCRRVIPALQQVLDADPNVKVIFREFPILSEGSVVAARASLAAQMQGKYEEFHFTMMGDDIDAYSIDEAVVMSVAERIGLDIDKMKEDMKSEEVAEHIATTRELANAMQFSGTPAFVIGETPVGGYIDGDAMLDIIAKTREANKG